MDPKTFMLAGLTWLAFLNVLLYIIKRRSPSRRWWVHPVNCSRQEEGEFVLFQKIKTTANDFFFEYCRMEVWQFKKLLQLSSPLLKKTSKRTLSPEMRLAITLRYLAHGGSTRAVAFSYRVGRTTAKKIIQETCGAIVTALKNQYMCHPNKEEWKRVARGFLSTWQFPNCLGAVDGKHIAIRCPPGGGSEYFNYKGYHSIMLMASCDAEYKFTWIDIGGYGSESDGGVFAKSEFGQTLLENRLDLPEAAYLPGSDLLMPFWFVADAAFPLGVNIMRPYPGRYLDETKSVFNYHLSRARRVIENAFGILVARWQIFQGRIQAFPKTVELMVAATASLHNFIMSTKPNSEHRYCPENFVDREANGQVIPGEWRKHAGNAAHIPLRKVGSNNATRANINRRNNLAEYFMSEEGELEWQYHSVSRGWETLCELEKVLVRNEVLESLRIFEYFIIFQRFGFMIQK